VRGPPSSGILRGADHQGGRGDQAEFNDHRRRVADLPASRCPPGSRNVSTGPRRPRNGTCHVESGAFASVGLSIHIATDAAGGIRNALLRAISPERTECGCREAQQNPDISHVFQVPTMYIVHSSWGGSSPAKFGIGNSLGLGYVTDGVFGTGSEVELTKAWGVYAAYDHVWWAGSRWRTSLYGGYVKFEYNDNAKALISQATCGAFRINNGTAVPFEPAATSGSLTGMTNCNPDFVFGYIGSRTQYNFTSEFYVGVDVTYAACGAGQRTRRQAPHRLSVCRFPSPPDRLARGRAVRAARPRPLRGGRSVLRPR
jgi:hypothetical protein